MKKFVKVMLIAAAVFAIAGIGFSTAGIVMGAGSEDSFQTLKRRFHGAVDNGFHLGDLDEIWDEVDYDDYDDYDDDDYDDDDVRRDRVVLKPEGNTVSAEESTVSEAAAGQNTDAGETEVYRFEAKDGLEIELCKETLILEEQDAQELTVEISGDSVGNVRINEEMDGLEILAARNRETGGTVKVSYPKGWNFREVELTAGDGEVELKNDFSADSLDIHVGAGAFTNIGKITAAETDFEVGAGKIVLQGLDAGEINGECGKGSIELELAGEKTDYSYSLECGQGSIQIKDEVYTTIRQEETIRNAGSLGYVELECGSGTISVSFLGK